MNQFFWSLTATLTATLIHADEVALVTLKSEKENRQFAIEFYESDAPVHVENFKQLARKGFYEDVAVHRVFPGLLVQMGDPLSKRKDRSRVGTGGPGYTIQAEIRRKHTKGAVAAARLPDKINPSRVSNGSQFYVCLAPMPNLDGQYTVFGKVLWGLEGLQQLSSKPADSNDYPLERSIIRSVKVLAREQLPPPAPSTEGPRQEKKPWWRIFG